MKKTPVSHSLGAHISSWSLVGGSGDTARPRLGQQGRESGTTVTPATSHSPILHKSPKSPGFSVPRPCSLPWCCGPPCVPHELSLHRGSSLRLGTAPPQELPLPHSAPHDSLGLWRHNVRVWQKRLALVGVWDFPPCTAPL